MTRDTTKGIIQKLEQLQLPFLLGLNDLTSWVPHYIGIQHVKAPRLASLAFCFRTFALVLEQMAFDAQLGESSTQTPQKLVE